MTLRIYAHVIPDAETDLSFLNLSGRGRPSPLSTIEGAPTERVRGDPGIGRTQHDSNMQTFRPTNG